MVRNRSSPYLTTNIEDGSKKEFKIVKKDAKRKRDLNDDKTINIELILIIYDLKLLSLKLHEKIQTIKRLEYSLARYRLLIEKALRIYFIL